MLLGLLVLLTVLKPGQISVYPSLVDWPTIAALGGLLVLTKGVELSGILHHLGKHLIALMPTERTVAMLLVSIAALLSTLLTNDVALFIVVPLTAGLRRVSTLPATRLIIFEALGANAGSALTPIGNPQNLFLSQLFRTPFPEYAGAMLPLALIFLVPLLLLTACAFSGRGIILRDDAACFPSIRDCYTCLWHYIFHSCCVSIRIRRKQQRY